MHQLAVRLLFFDMNTDQIQNPRPKLILEIIFIPFGMCLCAHKSKSLCVCCAVTTVIALNWVLDKTVVARVGTTGAKQKKTQTTLSSIILIYTRVANDVCRFHTESVMQFNKKVAARARYKTHKLNVYL